MTEYGDMGRMLLYMTIFSIIRIREESIWT